MPHTRFQVLVVPTSELPAHVLAWFCGCPVDAVTASRVGPIWLAHGGLWAEQHCQPSYYWPLLGGSLIHGRAAGICPDPVSGGWQALSEQQAEHARSVLWRFGMALPSAAVVAA